MPGHAVLVPLSSEHHFHSKFTYRRLAGLHLTPPWYYSTVACCFFVLEFPF